MRKLLKFIRKVLAKRVVERYKPVVVGVTGSVGKTTAREAIYAVLSRKFWVRKNDENFNNEIGVPMTILGVNPGRSSRASRLLSIVGSAWLAYGPFKSKYPKMLVLELAADRPGDIRYLVDIVKPRVGVVTAVGEVPVHVEFYAGPAEVAREKSELIKSLPAHDGLAVLNYDDQTVLDMKEKSMAKTATFGFSKFSDFAATDISYFAEEDGGKIGGISFKINFNNSFVPARINGLVGKHQLYGILAAAAVGTHFGINMVDITLALENIELPPGRMNLVHGIKNSIVIDDSYNASPLSVHAALDALNDFAKASKLLESGGRKIAVLGDMRELGKYQEQAHRAIGTLAAKRADMLITVGPAAKFVAEAAAEGMPAKRIASFDNSEEAKTAVKEIIKKGDIILVKGSHSMQMDKIVEEIHAF